MLSPAIRSSPASPSPVFFPSSSATQSFQPRLGKPCPGRLNKVEPFDLYSDLVLYNIEKNEVTAVQRTRNSQETNPNWSPDGKYLYYNSSDSVFKGPHAVFKMRYNLFRMAFNADSLSWGKPELVYNAASKMRSATYPRVSPDGKYLLFTEANYGTSTQTNKSADLYLMRLDSMTVRALD